MNLKYSRILSVVHKWNEELINWSTKIIFEFNLILPRYTYSKLLYNFHVKQTWNLFVNNFKITHKFPSRNHFFHILITSSLQGSEGLSKIFMHSYIRRGRSRRLIPLIFFSTEYMWKKLIINMVLLIKIKMVASELLNSLTYQQAHGTYVHVVMFLGQFPG